MIFIVYALAILLIGMWRVISWKLDPKPSPMAWVRAGVLTFFLLVGWIFIGWQNHFYLTASLVFVMLGYLAVVMTIYNLWRTGAAAVNDAEDDGDDSWGRPIGALDELDREKRTLLKAIKEAEFDHEMGKLSKADADNMITTYRARAIDVIKEIERVQGGKAGTVREQIEREVRARLEIEGKAGQKVHKQKKKDKLGAKAEVAAAPVAVTAPPDDEPSKPAADKVEAKADGVVDRDAETVESGGIAAAAMAEAKAETKAEATPESKAEEKAETKVESTAEANAEEKTEAKAEPKADESAAKADAPKANGAVPHDAADGGSAPPVAKSDANDAKEAAR